MRVLICDTQTGKFLSGAESWTQYREEALDLQHCEKAIVVAREKGFVKVEIVLDFGEPRYDIRLPFHRAPEDVTPPTPSPPVRGHRGARPRTGA